MRITNTGADFDGNTECPVDRKWGGGTNQAFEVLPIDIFHDDIMGVSILPDVMNCYNVRVRQIRYVARFLAESLQELRVVRQAGAQNLDSDGSPERQVCRAIDDGHAARPLLREQSVASV